MANVYKSYVILILKTFVALKLYQENNIGIQKLGGYN